MADQDRHLRGTAEDGSPVTGRTTRSWTVLVGLVAAAVLAAVVYALVDDRDWSTPRVGETPPGTTTGAAPAGR